ncbi:MAG: hypothetical protein WBE23_15810, partial [Candidatus Sulfotelmatobacter sp.]
SEHNRVTGRNAGLAEKLHVRKELLLGLGQNIAGVQHGIDLFQQRRRILDGDPIASVRAVVENFLQQDGKSWPGLSLQVTQEAAQIPNLGNVAKKK